MAAGTVSDGDLRGLLDGAPDGRPLAMLYLLDDPEAPTMRIVAFLLRYRQGGFMAILPQVEAVSAVLSVLEAEGAAAPPVYTLTTVPCETPRRRAVGEVDVYLVDFPWDCLAYFRRAATGRSPLTTVPLLSGETVVRPILAQAHAEAWIGTVGDDPDLQDAGLAEYWTAHSEQGDAEAGAANTSTPDRAPGPAKHGPEGPRARAPWKTPRLAPLLGLAGAGRGHWQRCTSDCCRLLA